MDGRILLYGKNPSPNLIAAASLCDSFSFDLQRFENVWSLGSVFTDIADYNDRYIFGEGMNSIASLGGDSSTSKWTLVGSADSIISLNLNSTAAATNSIASGSAINTSINDSTYTTFDATGAKKFFFTLSSNTKLTSIAGASSGSTIDARQVSGSGLSITGGAGDDSIYGSKKNDYITDGAGQDLFIYNGGDDTISGFSTGDSIKLDAGFKLINDGSLLESINGGFKLNFDNSNSLTFVSIDANAPVSIYGSGQNDTTPYQYTANAISIKGNADAGDSVTLGAYQSEEQPFSATSFKLVDASAVRYKSKEASLTSFAINGGTSSSYIIGSDYVVTSIQGSNSGNNTLKAGAKGASLYSGSSDFLIGSKEKDSFYYGGSSVTINSYTFGTDFVSLNTAPPTTFESIIAGDSNGNFIISLDGSGKTITFNSTSNVSLTHTGEGSGPNNYVYSKDRIIVDYERITLGSEYKGKKFNINDIVEDYGSITSIDASANSVSGGLNITALERLSNKEMISSIVGAATGGNIIGSEGKDFIISSGTSSLHHTTLNGGASGDDTLKGHNGGIDIFRYISGADSIGGFSAVDGDYIVIPSKESEVEIANATVTVDDASNPETLIFNFGGSDSLSIAGGVSQAVSINAKGGTFVYAGSIVSHNNDVTLLPYYNASTPFEAKDNFASIKTIDASQIAGNKGISIVGNELNNNIIGTSLSNSLDGGDGNDTLTGGNNADVFYYSHGKDVINNYQYAVINNGETITDSLMMDNVSEIKSAKVSGTKLVFTIEKNKDVLTFDSDNEVVEKISLGGGSGGYLTKDGLVSIGSDNAANSLTLFESARSTIDVSSALYSLGANKDITMIDASASKQGVTLIGKSLESATYLFNSSNRKRDLFTYNGGGASISGYEFGKDRINLGTASISGFSVSGGNEVLISIGGGDFSGEAGDVISISGGKDKETLIRQDNGRNYSKLVFHEAGIFYNKPKPTIATVMSGAASLEAVDTIKKIFAVGGVSNISIQAGDKNNTQINAKEANGLSIVGGKRNDKITLSGGDDLFEFKLVSGTGGKDAITGFSTSDSITINDANNKVSLTSAKISNSGKSLKIKFDSKNTLTIKGDSLKSALNIDNGKYIFGKNKIIDEGGTAVSLTSEFGGTYNTKTDSTTYVDAKLSEKTLTLKGQSTKETLAGGTKKTTFKGGGGADSLVGGSGNDIFFYAKGDNDNGEFTTIDDFDYTKDKIKIANGTIKEISKQDNKILFSMNDGKNKDNAIIGGFQINSFATYDKNGIKQDVSSSNKSILIHANNTYYWFDDSQSEITITETTSSSDGETSTKETVISSSDTNGFVTWDQSFSSSALKDAIVIDLNYSSNLVKTGVATKLITTAPSGSNITGNEELNPFKNASEQVNGNN